MRPIRPTSGTPGRSARRTRTSAERAVVVPMPIASVRAATTAPPRHRRRPRVADLNSANISVMDCRILAGEAGSIAWAVPLHHSLDCGACHGWQEGRLRLYSPLMLLSAALVLTLVAAPPQTG